MGLLDDQRASTKPHSMGRLQAPALARIKVRPGHNDKQHQSSRKNAGQSQPQNAQCTAPGILRNVTKGLRKIHSTFGRFGPFNMATEQLISRVNMFFQHYHVSMNLGKKLDASLLAFKNETVSCVRGGIGSNLNTLAS